MEPYDDNGVVYQLEKSSASQTGYLHVVEPRPGQFHAKLKLPGETKQSFLPGAACKTAQEAALRVAKYKADPQALVKSEPAVRRQPKVRCLAASPNPRIGAHVLLNAQKKRMLSDVDIGEEHGNELGWPVWVMCDSTFRLWRTGGHPPPEFRLSPAAAAEVARLKAWAKEHELQEEEEAAWPKPTPRQQHEKRPPSQRPWQLQPPQPPQPPQMPPVTVEALHPTQFDPAVLQRVAAIKARASPTCVVSPE